MQIVIRGDEIENRFVEQLSDLKQIRVAPTSPRRFGYGATITKFPGSMRGAGERVCVWTESGGVF